MNKKIILAFSGGLDTSYCALYLKSQGYDVHTVYVQTGGVSNDELKQIESKAIKLGVISHTNLDVRSTFYTRGIRFLIYGNVLKNHSYPLSVSAERYFQAEAIARHAVLTGIGAIAHGSTGAGNDQVRFDLVFNVLCPQIEIITPIRDHKLSREEEIAFIKDFGIEFSAEKSNYSINQGLWGTSVGGKETLGSRLPLPEEAYPIALTTEQKTNFSLTFKKGEVVAINDEYLSPLELIEKLSFIANPFAVGRDIHVGDTIVGIKGRVGFQASAAMVLIKAHQLLEKHTLSKWQLHWKDQIANFYGQLLHEAQFMEPCMRDFEALLESSQKRVSGKVFVELQPHRIILEGIESPFDLMQAKFGTYGEMNELWTAEDVKGYIKMLSAPHSIYQSFTNHD